MTLSSEDRVLAAVKEMLKTHDKCVGLRITSTIGMPDLIACVNGRFVGIEVKYDKEGSYGMTKAQRIRLRQIVKAGGVGCCVDKNNLQSFKKLLDLLCEDATISIKCWGYTDPGLE